VAGVSAKYAVGLGAVDAALSYSDSRSDSRGIDLDLTALTTGAGSDKEVEKTWNGEIRFTSPDDAAFQYIIGTSCYRESTSLRLATLIGLG
jgi:hypothetical protein